MSMTGNDSACINIDIGHLCLIDLCRKVNSDKYMCGFTMHDGLAVSCTEGEHNSVNEHRDA